jgi:hypothetical protein
MSSEDRHHRLRQHADHQGLPVEIVLISKYQIYEELSLGLELGYINADFDKDVWGLSWVATATS